MRLLAIAFLAWLTATFTTSAAFAIVYSERPSAEDLLGHGISTFVTASVLVLAFYLPAVWLLRRRFGPKLPVVQAVATTGVIANAPAFLALALLAGRADLFAGGEAAWMAFQFLLFGVLFGLGVARYGQGQPDKQLLQTPQTLCGLLPCCFATAASVDMRRSRIARR